MKTYVPKQGEIERKWYVIDAGDQVLGRVAAEAAKLLRGKHKPQYTPFLDCGDHVIIVNVDKIRVTGDKVRQKKYYHHTGYMGGLTEVTYGDLARKHPTRAIMTAIRGMLPHNRLGRQLAKHVRVYVGPDHHQEAQNPQPYPMGK